MIEVVSLSVKDKGVKQEVLVTEDEEVLSGCCSRVICIWGGSNSASNFCLLEKGIFKSLSCMTE